MKTLAAAALAALLAGALAAPVAAAPLCDDFGFAGLLAACNKQELPPITLSAGKPIAEGPWHLQSGVHYEVEIIADGTQELGLVGPEFFRAVWIDEIAVDDIEIHPLALGGIEFGDEGTIELSFIAIMPGRFELKIPGTTGETQRVQITIQ